MKNTTFVDLTIFVVFVMALSFIAARFSDWFLVLGIITYTLVLGMGIGLRIRMERMETKHELRR